MSGRQTLSQLLASCNPPYGIYDRLITDEENEQCPACRDEEMSDASLYGDTEELHTYRFSGCSIDPGVHRQLVARHADDDDPSSESSFSCPSSPPRLVRTDGYSIPRPAILLPVGRVPVARRRRSVVEDEAGCSDTDDDEFIAPETQADRDFIVDSDDESMVTNLSSPPSPAAIRRDVTHLNRPRVALTPPGKVWDDDNNCFLDAPSPPSPEGSRERRLRASIDGYSSIYGCPRPEPTDSENDWDGVVDMLLSESSSQSTVEDSPSVPEFGASGGCPERSSDPKKRSKRFALTLNNPCPLEIAAFENLFSFTSFRLYGKEHWNGGGTPHMQCYVELSGIQVSIAKLQKMITAAQGFPSRYAVFVCKGTAKQNIEYCSKDGDVFQTGIVPKGQGKRSDLEAVSEEIANGSSLADVAKAHGPSFIKYAGGFQKLWNVFNSKKRTTRTKGLWCFGLTGTGKSRFAHSLTPDSTFVKNAANKWWDGYEQEDTVILDDYRCNAQLGFSDLLRLADFHPLPIEMKGASGHFNSKRVIITTPLSIDETFASLDWMTEGSIAQLKRRFVELEFGPDKLSHTLSLVDLAALETDAGL